jgi:hypothetical protein
MLFKDLNQFVCGLMQSEVAYRLSVYRNLDLECVQPHHWHDDLIHIGRSCVPAVRVCVTVC